MAGAPAIAQEAIDRSFSSTGGAAAPGQRDGAAIQTFEQGATRRDGAITSLSEPEAGTVAQRVSSVASTQDLVGQRLNAVATYKAVPSAAENSVVEVYFGEWSGGSCRLRAAILGAAEGGVGAGGFFDDNGQTGSFAASSTRNANIVTITSVTSGAFRTADYDCTWATVRDISGSPRFQNFFATDLTTTYIPKLTVSTIDPIQGNYPGRWTTVSLDAVNDGRADALGTRVTASGSGLKFNRKSVALGTLEDRRSRYGIDFKVKLSGKKSRTATFTITSAGGHSDTVRVTIARKPKPSKVRSLAGRYYWGNDPGDRSKGWDPRAVMFLNKKWAYVGFPPNGTPSCRKASKTCKRYSYKNGRLKLGSKSGRVDSEGFKLGRVDYSRLALPKRNAKLSLALQHQDFRGCGSNLYCSTWTETLSMGNDRRFVLTETSIASIGVPGVGTITSRVGPDERGRYEVLSKGRIRFIYDSGKRVTRTIGIEYDVRGKANAAGAGVVVGDVNYYRPRGATT